MCGATWLCANRAGLLSCCTATPQRAVEENKDRLRLQAPTRLRRAPGDKYEDRRDHGYNLGSALVGLHTAKYRLGANWVSAVQVPKIAMHTKSLGKCRAVLRRLLQPLLKAPITHFWSCVGILRIRLVADKANQPFSGLEIGRLVRSWIGAGRARWRRRIQVA